VFWVFWLVFFFVVGLVFGCGGVGFLVFVLGFLFVFFGFGFFLLVFFFFVTTPPHPPSPSLFSGECTITAFTRQIQMEYNSPL